MRRNEIAKTTRGIRLGDHRLRTVKVTEAGVLFSITGRENGFETRFVLSKYAINLIKEFVRDNCNVVNRPHVIIKHINNIQMKSRELTRCENEAQFSYKYYSTNTGCIKISHHSELIVMTFYDSRTERIYRTISFRINDILDSAPAFFRGIERAAGEYSMRNFWM